MSISSPAPTTEQSQTYQNFIGGAWRASRSGKTFVSTNPAHPSEVVGYYQKSTAADVEDAIDAAVRAQPAWAATPAPERGELLFGTVDVKAGGVACSSCCFGCQESWK